MIPGIKPQRDRYAASIEAYKATPNLATAQEVMNALRALYVAIAEWRRGNPSSASH